MFQVKYLYSDLQSDNFLDVLRHVDLAMIYFCIYIFYFQNIYRLSFTCSNSTIEALGNTVKYVQS